MPSNSAPPTSSMKVCNAIEVFSALVAMNGRLKVSASG